MLLQNAYIEKNSETINSYPLDSEIFVAMQVSHGYNYPKEKISLNCWMFVPHRIENLSWKTGVRLPDYSVAAPDITRPLTQSSPTVDLSKTELWLELWWQDHAKASSCSVLRRQLIKWACITSSHTYPNSLKRDLMDSKNS